MPFGEVSWVTKKVLIILLLGGILFFAAVGVSLRSSFIPYDVCSYLITPLVGDSLLTDPISSESGDVDNPPIPRKISTESLPVSVIIDYDLNCSGVEQHGRIIDVFSSNNSGNRLLTEAIIAVEVKGAWTHIWYSYWLSEEPFLIKWTSFWYYTPVTKSPVLQAKSPIVEEGCSNSTTNGALVYGLFQLINFILAPIIGSFINAVGAQILLYSGVFTAGTSAIVFGLLYLVPGPQPFITVSFITGIIQAVGTTLTIISIFATMSFIFPDNVAITIAALETIQGVGTIVGPMLGSSLYTLGGFPAPFVTIGVILLVGGILLLLFLRTMLVKFKILPGTTESDGSILVSEENQGGPLGSSQTTPSSLQHQKAGENLGPQSKNELASDLKNLTGVGREEESSSDQPEKVANLETKNLGSSGKESFLEEERKSSSKLLSKAAHGVSEEPSSFLEQDEKSGEVSRTILSREPGKVLHSETKLLRQQGKEELTAAAATDDNSVKVVETTTVRTLFSGARMPLISSSLTTSKAKIPLTDEAPNTTSVCDVNEASVKKSVPQKKMLGKIWPFGATLKSKSEDHESVDEENLPTKKSLKSKLISFGSAIKAAACKMWSLISSPPVLMNMLNVLGVGVCSGFYIVLLQPLLKELSVSNEELQLILLTPGITNAIISPVFGVLCDLKPTFKRKLLMSGAVLVMLSLVLVGLVPPTVNVIITGLVFLGIGSGAIMVTSFSDSVSSALEQGHLNDIGTFAVISALWTAAFSLGNALGPVVAIILQNFGAFKWGILVILIVELAVLFGTGTVAWCEWRQKRSCPRYKKIESRPLIEERKSLPLGYGTCGSCGEDICFQRPEYSVGIVVETKSKAYKSQRIEKNNEG